MFDSICIHVQVYSCVRNHLFRNPNVLDLLVLVGFSEAEGMSFDLLLKPSCSGCGSSTDLYGSNCKHMTLCLSCGKTMAENHGKCYDCGTPVTRLIRVYLFFSLFKHSLKFTAVWEHKWKHSYPLPNGSFAAEGKVCSCSYLVFNCRNIMFGRVAVGRRITSLVGLLPAYRLFQRKKMLITNGLCIKKGSKDAKFPTLCGYWVHLIYLFFNPTLCFICLELSLF